MRARQAFDRGLQIKIQCSPDRAAQSWFLRHDRIHKMWCKARWIVAHDFRRFCQQRLLIACDKSQLSKASDRSCVLTIRYLRMPPGIEASWRLWQTGQKNCFAQGEIASRFAKIGASGGLRAESPVPVAAAIQVFRQNSLLAPAPLQFTSDDGFVHFAAPTAPVTAVREFHELLSDCGCARNNLPRSQIPCACRNGRAPVNAAVFIKPPVFQRHRYAWQPRSHLLKCERKLGARFR